jgi:hypothetical protein
VVNAILARFDPLFQRVYKNITVDLLELFKLLIAGYELRSIKILPDGEDADVAHLPAVMIKKLLKSKGTATDKEIAAMLLQFDPS